jgi:hypothetical protein
MTIKFRNIFRSDKYEINLNCLCIAIYIHSLHIAYDNLVYKHSFAIAILI